MEDDAFKARWTERMSGFTDIEARRHCERWFGSFTTLSDTLSKWFDKERIKGWRWREDGRVFFERHDGIWWSGVSPLTEVGRLVSIRACECLSGVLLVLQVL